MSDRHLLDSLVAALTDLGEGVAVVDITTRRYVSVNGALIDMLGYSEEEFLALPSFFSTLPPDEVELLEPDLAARLAGQPVDGDRYGTRVIRKDGAELEVE